MHILSSDSITGTQVENRQGENLGDIKEVMLDTDTGRVIYAVLDFGGFLGIGNKLFAMPWEAFTIDTVNEQFVLDVDKETLENAPGFDQDDWPDMNDLTYAREVYTYYNYDPFWETV